MSKITKALISATLAAVMLAGCNKAPATNQLDKIKAAGKLVVSTSPDYAPFEFEDLRKTGQEAYAGSDIELAKYIAQKLGVELVIEPMEFGAVVAATSEGRADLAISGLNINPERSASAELSKVYYAGETQGLITLKDKAGDFKTIADLKGKTVAAQNGSVQLEIAQDQLKESKIEIITALNDGIMMLQTGKVDAVAVDTTTGEQFVENYPELAIAPIIFEYESEGFVVAAKKGETALMEEINKIIDELVASGEYSKWLIESIALSEELSIAK